MKLLKYENYEVTPSEELFLVKPFRDIYNKDKTKNHESFMQQIAYIYWMYDPRSSYADVLDEELRSKLVKEQEGLPNDFVPSNQLLKAIDVYKTLTTTTSQKLLESMRKAVAKVGEYLENVDLYAIDEKGKRIDSVTSIVAATDKVPNLAKKLIETERIVTAEITESARMRGGEEQAHAFEGGF